MSRRLFSNSTNPNPKGSHKAFLVDTLDLVKSLESQGVAPNKAGAISVAIVEVISKSLETVSDKFVSTAEMDKNVKLQQTYMSAFKCELEASQERHFIKLKDENHNLQTYLEKMHTSLTDKIDHVIRLTM
ncbi:hypothetical protein L1987_76671 [Smallanthus sonchifolius]|uniref:Uncharacterized protein n=1 Tax=Smallanthus sonchifolius TaxID=185202 RepID=A0ACB8Z8W3_9ASTR|nr:hypothetical protein L1987_76671 [Smallanthus sonchifolius]